MPIFGKGKNEEQTERPVIERISSGRWDNPLASVIASPTDEVILIRDGKVIDTFTEEKLRTREGVTGTLSAIIGAGKDVTVLRVDLRPFKVEMSFGEHPPPVNAEPIPYAAPDSTGEHASMGIVLEVVVDDDNVSKMMWLSGTETLTQSEIQDHLTPQIFAAIQPIIASSEIRTLRTTEGILSLETEMMEILRDEAEYYGLLVREISVIWGASERHRQQAEGEHKEPQEVTAAFAHERGISELKREAEVNRVRIANIQKAQKLDAEGNEELRDLHLISEVGRDQLFIEGVLSRAAVEAQISVINIDITAQEASADLLIEKAKTDAQHSQNIKDSELDLKVKQADADREYNDRVRNQAIENEKDDENARRNIEQAKARGELKTAKMSELALIKAQKDRDKAAVKEQEAHNNHQRELAAATADHLRQLEILRFNADTAHKTRMADVETVRLRMQSDERLLKEGMSTGQVTADVFNTLLKQGTKRDASDTVRAQQTVYPQPSVYAPPPVFTPLPVAPPLAPAGVISACSNCQKSLQPEWQACLYCQTPVVAAALKNCTNCNQELQPRWIACPACRTPV